MVGQYVRPLPIGSFIGMLFSLGLGFTGAFVLGRLITLLAANSKPTRAKKRFDRLQMLSAGFLAFNHGLNDGQKFMGVFALTLVAGGAIPTFEISWWVILICALTMGAV